MYLFNRWANCANNHDKRGDGVKIADHGPIREGRDPNKYTYGEMELFKKFYSDAYGITKEDEEKRPGARFHPRQEEPRPISSFYGGFYFIFFFISTTSQK